MKLIMENWRKYSAITEDIHKPTTWGELSQKILMTKAASKWPRIGKAFVKMGFKYATSVVKSTVDALSEVEEILDYIPDEWQEKIEAGTAEGAEYLAKFAKEKGLK